jgi:hypothetical protein
VDGVGGALIEFVFRRENLGAGVRGVGGRMVMRVVFDMVDS